MKHFHGAGLRRFRPCRFSTPTLLRQRGMVCRKISEEQLATLEKTTRWH